VTRFDQTSISKSSCRTILSFLVLALTLAFTVCADPIPYPTPGTINPTSYTFTAITNGDITAYFTGSGDATFGSLGMLVNGVSTGNFGLGSQTSAFGDSFNLGYVNAGDTIVFQLNQTLNYGLGGSPAIGNIYSDPTLNAPYDNQNHGGAALPGFNHVYAARYDATADVAPADGLPGIPLSAGIPGGLFVGFEGNPIPGNPNYFSTDDYNSYTFIVTDVGIFGVEAIPEPSTSWLLLLGAGLLISKRFA
jgi:hypothetical protein